MEYWATKLKLQFPLLFPWLFLNTYENRGGGENHPLFLRNYPADHPEIRYIYGSDHSDGLPIGSGAKCPELKTFRKVRNFLHFRRFVDEY